MKTKQSVKRLFAVLVALAVMLSAIPMVTFAAEITSYVVAGVELLCGSDWDGYDLNNQMTLDGDVYTLTFSDVAIGEDYQLKVVGNYDNGSQDWFGTVLGDNIRFNITSVCDVTVTFDPTSEEITVTGAGVEFITELEVDEMIAVGNGSGNWLGGFAWDPAAEANVMTEVSPDVYQITFEDVAASDNYEVKFAANGTWTENWGGDLIAFGVECNAVYNSLNNICIDTTVYETSDVTLTLDLTDFDYLTKTGAKFKVDVVDAVSGATPPPAEIMTLYFTDTLGWGNYSSIDLVTYDGNTSKYYTLTEEGVNSNGDYYYSCTFNATGVVDAYFGCASGETVLFNTFEDGMGFYALSDIDGYGYNYLGTYTSPEEAPNIIPPITVYFVDKLAWEDVLLVADGDTDIEPVEATTDDDGNTVFAFEFKATRLSYFYFEKNDGNYYTYTQDITFFEDGMTYFCTDKYTEWDDYVEYDVVAYPYGTDIENSIRLEIGDAYGDGWNDAAINVYKDGQLLDTFTFEDGYESMYYVPYDAQSFYVFEWVQGNYDEECILGVYLPNEDEAAFEKENFSDTEEGEVLFYLGEKADYTEVESAIDSVPADILVYTNESISELLEALDTVVWYLPSTRQAEVDAMAEAINDALAGLELLDDTAGRINVADGNVYITETGYTVGEGNEEIPYTGPYTLLGMSSENSVYVLSGTHDITFLFLEIITLDDPDYDPESLLPVEPRSPLEISSGATVNLTLIGENFLVSERESSAGLNVPDGAELNILGGSGSLYVLGGTDAAGIGGHEDEDAGTITIEDGDITAKSSSDGAGIGGGYGGSAGTIVINGGTIYAECIEDDGAGIGAGDDGEGGSITINGGNITALSLYDDGAGIGAGDDGRVDEIIINGGYMVVGSDDAAAIGTQDNTCGKIIINGGTIVVHEGHSDAVIIGSANDIYQTEDENNFVQINGGNIISEANSVIAPAPVNEDGVAVERFDFTVEEEFADQLVTVETPDGLSVTVLAVGTSVTVYLPASEQGADYTDVDAAIDNVPADLSIYTDESAAAVTAAVEAVVRDLGISEQARVDAMAEAINDAVAGLTLKPTATPTPTPTPSGNPTDAPTNNPTDAPTNNPTDVPEVPATGDNGNITALVVLFLGGAACVAAMTLCRKKEE